MSILYGTFLHESKKKNYAILRRIIYIFFAGFLTALVLATADIQTGDYVVKEEHNVTTDKMSGDFVKSALKEKKKQEYKEKWLLVSTKTVATVYNAVPEQCNSDASQTASGFKINQGRAGEHKVIAMERTMMKRLGIRFGDVVRVENAGSYDGEWRVEDVLSARYANTDRIDFLVHNNVRVGKWNNVKIYKLKNRSDKDYYIRKFLGPRS